MKKLETTMKIIGITLILLCTFLAFANDVSGQTPQDSVKTCKAIKSDKTNCKSTFIVKGAEFCRSHNPDAIKCSGVNSKKQPCGMTVKAKGDLCRFHKN